MINSGPCVTIATTIDHPWVIYLARRPNETDAYDIVFLIVVQSTIFRYRCDPRYVRMHGAQPRSEMDPTLRPTGSCTLINNPIAFHLVCVPYPFGALYTMVPKLINALNFVGYVFFLPVDYSFDFDTVLDVMPKWPGMSQV